MNIDLIKLTKTLGDFTTENLNELLDQRDSSLFETLWLEARAEVPEGKAPEELKHIFISVSNATNQHEIASYIADDIELISHAKMSESKNKFVIQLAKKYANGEFPHEIQSV